MTAPATDPLQPTPVAGRSAAPDSPPARKASPLAGARRLLWPVIGLVLLLILDAIFIPGFFGISIADGRLAGTLVEIFRWSGPEILLAIGMTLVLATGGVDLSVGAVMALAGAICAQLLTTSGWPPGLAIGAAIVASLAAGAWNGALVTLLDIQPIVATLVLMVAGRGIAQTIGGSAHVAVSGKIFERLGGSTFGLPTEGLVGLLAFSILTAAFVHPHQRRPADRSHGQQPYRQPVCRRQRQARHISGLRLLRPVRRARRFASDRRLRPARRRLTDWESTGSWTRFSPR